MSKYVKLLFKRTYNAIDIMAAGAAAWGFSTDHLARGLVLAFLILIASSIGETITKANKS